MLTLMFNRTREERDDTIEMTLTGLLATVTPSCYEQLEPLWLKCLMPHRSMGLGYGMNCLYKSEMPSPSSI